MLSVPAAEEPVVVIAPAVATPEVDAVVLRHEVVDPG